MKTTRIGGIVLAFSLTAFTSALAIAQQHTLKETAQKAVLSSPEVLQRWHAYQAAVNEKEVAFGGYLPRVDLNASVARERRDDPLLKANYNSHSTTVQLSQMLYDGFGTRDEVRRLDHARVVRLFELFDASENTALEAAKAYLDVLRYRKLVGLAEENYVHHRAVHGQIQKKAQAGVGRRVDFEQAAGRLALAEANLLTETANLHDVSARYQRLVGDTPGKDLADAPPMGGGLPNDPGAILKTAQDKNPGLRAAVENVRAATAALGARKAAYQPRLDLRLREDRGTDLNGYLGSTNNRTAEVVATWNLFNGLSDVARSRQYADQLNVAKDLRDKACRDMRQTVAIAYDDVRKLTDSLVYLDQHQLSTEKVRDAYRKQFDIGQRSLLDLLDTENELFQAKRAYVNAEYDLATAHARTHAGLGNLLATLGLSRIGDDTVPDPVAWESGADSPEYCPPDAPVLYVADKDALNVLATRSAQESALPAASVAAATPAAVSERELAEALKGWAAAWSGRNVAAYLGYYAPSFVPAGGGTHAAWADSRKRTIENAGDIRLDIGDVEVTTRDEQRAATTFHQNYHTSKYQDNVLKTLQWQKLDGRWLIIRESAKGL
jgi:adhesin transport system outer membrane protein